MKKIVDKILSVILIALMAFMVINVLWQVASRFILNSPSDFTDELAGFQLIWVGLLGAAYGTGQNLHLAIDLLPDKLKGAKKKMLQYFINLCILSFALSVMVIGGIRLVYLTFILEQFSSALQLSMGYVYLVLPLSGVIIVFYCVLEFFQIRNQPNELN